MIPRLGIIGAGSVSKFHIEAAKSAGFEVNSISASDKSRSAKYISREYQIKHYFEKTQELILSDTFDCLSVLTHPIITTELLVKLSELNIPVLVEKPVTLESDNLVKFMNSNCIFVNFNRRFYETVTEFKRISLLKNGIFNFTTTESIPGNTDLLMEVESSVKTNTVHILDLLYFLCGDVTLINPQYSQVNHTLNYTLCIEDKFVGTFTISFNSVKNTIIEFESDKLNMKLSPIETLTKLNNIEIIPPDLEYAYNRYQLNYKHPKGTNLIKESGRLKPGFLGVYNTFFNFCNSIKVTQNLPTLNDARRALVLAEKITEQYRSVLS